MTDCVVVLTTVGSRIQTERIAKELLNSRLVACVQITGPIRSSYWWKDKIESSQEWYCIIKTISGKYPEIEKSNKIATLL